MSTNFTVNGEHMANRFWAGKTHGGSAVQMEMTEREWHLFFTGVSQEWVSETGETWESGEAWMEDHKDCVILWDSAARQNQMARDMEDHRFVGNHEPISSMLLASASKNRERAKLLAREQLRSV